MPITLKSGNSGNIAEVNNENQLVVRSIVEPEIEHASLSGKAYAWDSLELNIDATDTMLYLQNTGDTPLIIDHIAVNGSNVVCIWTIHLGTATTTATGTVVIGRNLHTAFAGKLAEANAFSDETAVADGFIVGRVKTAVDGHHLHPGSGIILAKNHYIQITQVTESTSGSVTIVGHFENPS